jgi:catechol 2,3-dioxygenase-like lactoylglutathione lyase family enzyme
MNNQAESNKLQLRLELIPLPVTDIDRAKAFYAGKIGFHVDHDVSPGEGMRLVQLTPPGSSCSIALGKGIGEFDTLQPGAIKGVHLVVDDIEMARKTLLDRGVAIADIMDMGGVKYASFADEDGNSWLLQEIPASMKMT